MKRTGADQRGEVAPLTGAILCLLDGIVSPYQEKYPNNVANVVEC